MDLFHKILKFEILSYLGWADYCKKKKQDLAEKFRKMNHNIAIKIALLIDLIRSYVEILPNSLDSCKIA